MDIRKIRKLIELIDETGVMEIEIKEGEESVRLSRGQPQYLTAPHQFMAASPSMTSSASARDSKESTPVNDTLPGHVLKAPMVGTLYIAPSPGSQPFVETGQIVKKGDVVCIIEAMKMMNQIEADCHGTIKARLVDNGAPIEFGQPLFIIEEP